MSLNRQTPSQEFTQHIKKKLAYQSSEMTAKGNSVKKSLMKTLRVVRVNDAGKSNDVSSKLKQQLKMRLNERK